MWSLSSSKVASVQSPARPHSIRPFRRPFVWINPVILNYKLIEKTSLQPNSTRSTVSVDGAEVDVSGSGVSFGPWVSDARQLEKSSWPTLPQLTMLLVTPWNRMFARKKTFWFVLCMSSMVSQITLARVVDLISCSCLSVKTPAFSCQKRSPRFKAMNWSRMMQPAVGPTSAPAIFCSFKIPAYRSTSSGSSYNLRMLFHPYKKIIQIGKYETNTRWSSLGCFHCTIVCNFHAAYRIV